MQIDSNGKRKGIIYLISIFGVVVVGIIAINQALNNGMYLIQFSVFFIMLALTHERIVNEFRDSKFRSIIIIFLYTVVVDGFIYIFVTRKFSLVMIYPALIVAFLLLSGGILNYLVNYQLQRSRLNKIPPDTMFEGRVRNLKLEITHRHEYDVYILGAFVVTGILGFILQWNLILLLLRFLEISIGILTLIVIIKLYLEARKMYGDMSELHLPNGVVPKEKEFSVSKLTEWRDALLKKTDDLQKEVIIDFFDRSGEVRKLYLYNSMFLVVLMSLYLSVYSTISDKVLEINQGQVIIIGVALALLCVQLPYYLGQKRLSFELSKPFVGTAHREILKILGKESPAWNFIQTIEVIGAAVISPVIIFGVKKAIEHISTN